MAVLHTKLVEMDKRSQEYADINHRISQYNRQVDEISREIERVEIEKLES